MILSDREIEAALNNKLIKIDPMPPKELWTSTAIDLTLDGVIVKWNIPKPSPTGQSSALRPFGDGFNVQEMTKDPKLVTSVKITTSGYLLEPQGFVLGFTKQSIYLPNSSRLAARVEGKSSLARLGVGVHVTAPTIHAGFGFNPKKPDQPGLQIQLEIFNLGNQTIVLDEDMPICQLIIEEVREAPFKGYIGKFSEQESFSTETQN
jgi:dCTP deaminase